MILLSQQKENKRPDFNKEYVFYQPRDGPVNQTSIDETNKITGLIQDQEFKIRYHDKIKECIVPTKEMRLNVDNRVNSFLKLLLSQHERILNSGFSVCDEELPTFSVGDILIENAMDFTKFQQGSLGFGILAIADTRTDQVYKDLQCMGESLLKTLQQDFFNNGENYYLEGKKIQIARMDIGKEEVMNIAKRFGLKIDDQKQRLGPQLIFLHNGEFFHWTHGLQRRMAPAIIHWINRIANPFQELNSLDEAEAFMQKSYEVIERNPFLNEKNAVQLGKLYDNSILKTRVIILEKDPRQIHNALEAARHLADRYDLRFGFSKDDEVLKDYDRRYSYLTNHKMVYGTYDTFLVVNHRDQHSQMGLHNGHNPNAEQSIKDFVNRESISDLDDINSESINTISMISDDMPILLVFIDLDLWKKDKEAAEYQRDVIENVVKESRRDAHHKVVPILVPIDNSSEYGNNFMLQKLGVFEQAKKFKYPQMVITHPKRGLYQHIEPENLWVSDYFFTLEKFKQIRALENLSDIFRQPFQWRKKIVKYTVRSLVNQINELEVLKTKEYKILDMENLESYAYDFYLKFHKFYIDLTKKQIQERTEAEKHKAEQDQLHSDL